MSGRASASMTPIGQVVASVRRRTRYDLVLAVIPAALALGLLLGATTPVPSPVAVAAAAAVGVLAMVDALFINPPRGPTAGESPV